RVDPGEVSAHGLQAPQSDLVLLVVVHRADHGVGLRPALVGLADEEARDVDGEPAIDRGAARRLTADGHVVAHVEGLDVGSADVEPLAADDPDAGDLIAVAALAAAAAVAPVRRARAGLGVGARDEHRRRRARELAPLVLAEKRVERRRGAEDPRRTAAAQHALAPTLMERVPALPDAPLAPAGDGDRGRRRIPV